MRSRRLIPILLICALVLLAGCSAQQETPATAAAEASGAEVSTPTAQVEGGESGEPAPPAEGGEDGSQRAPGGPGGFGGASQLALHTLYLQSTDYAITAEQAEALLPLWQELQSLQAGDEINPEQIQTMIEEINGQMTGEQTALLTDLSQEDLAAWAEEQGYMVGFGGPSEMGEGGPPEMSEEERATAQAERPEGPPENQPEDMPEGAQSAAPANNLVDEVISMLESLAAG
jgi:hypothetical protein